MTTSDDDGGYDRLASQYRLLEWMAFRNQLQQARIALVDELSSARHALVLGDGDGRLLAGLVERLPECRFTSVDRSCEMLAQQRRRIADLDATGRLEFVHQDATKYDLPRNGYDLVVTAFFLDCFDCDTLHHLIPQLARAAKQTSAWYFVDFQLPPSGRLRRLHASSWLTVMHAYFRWQTDLQTRGLVNVESIFLAHGWVCAHRRDRYHGLLTSRLYRRVRVAT